MRLVTCFIFSTLLFGCELQPTDIPTPVTDCRNVNTACIEGFSCENDGSGTYVCVEETETDAGSSDAGAEAGRWVIVIT